MELICVQPPTQPKIISSRSAQLAAWYLGNFHGEIRQKHPVCKSNQRNIGLEANCYFFCEEVSANS